ncbi:MAG: glycosyltransferase, partial [Gemmatimonadaceae bacterium]|nr:glycosyltransferase [Gemmatimonadaceae bacterium]
MTRPVLLLGHAGVLGGAERSLLDAVPALAPASAMLFADGPLRAALEARGIPTVVHAMRDIGRVRKETRRPTVRALRDAWRLAGVVAAHAAPDAILYANSQKAFVIAALSVLRRRRPLIWHLRDLLGAPHFSTLNARAVTWLANRCATRVIVNSHAAGDAFVASGGRAALVRVVHNGIDAAPFVSAQPSRDATRRALGVDGRWVIATVGRIAPWKGQQVVIDALSRLPGDVHALIIGAPLFGEDAFAEALVAQANDGIDLARIGGGPLRDLMMVGGPVAAWSARMSASSPA